MTKRTRTRKLSPCYLLVRTGKEVPLFVVHLSLFCRLSCFLGVCRSLVKKPLEGLGALFLFAVSSSPGLRLLMLSLIELCGKETNRATVQRRSRPWKKKTARASRLSDVAIKKNNIWRIFSFHFIHAKKNYDRTLPSSKAPMTGRWTFTLRRRKRGSGTWVGIFCFRISFSRKESKRYRRFFFFSPRDSPVWRDENADEKT